MFDTISNRLGDVFSRLRAKGKLNEADVDAALREVRLALLEADVNVVVVKSFLGRVKERAVGSEVTKSLTPGQQVIKIVHEELLVTLGDEAPLVRPSAPPLVILMAGLQGSGKTTTSAKLAKHLKSKGKRPLLVAADLQRPAAIDQLETLGKRIGVPVYADRRASRVTKLAKAAQKQARDDGNNVLIFDTAGRLQIDDDLMKELAALEKAIDPDEVLLVVDAMTGQEAVNVAKGFLSRTELTGLVLTKLDGDARGGAAISAREVTGRPIKFVGVGEGIDDLDVFHPDRMASRILGMGDVMSLIEKAEAAYDEDQAAAAAEKLRTSSFTLEDFLEQFQQLRKMGPLQQLVSMLPGAGQMLKDVDVDERDLNRVEAIIRSMTPGERRNPKVINGSRKRRIASGSGTRPQDVNAVLKQFSEAQKMMKAFSAGKSPIPGLALPGMGRQKKR